jgi:hypothetical protein
MQPRLDNQDEASPRPAAVADVACVDDKYKDESESSTASEREGATVTLGQAPSAQSSQSASSQGSLPDGPSLHDSDDQTIRAPKRPPRSGAFVVSTVGVAAKSSKDLFSTVTAELGWKEIARSVPKKAQKTTIHCVMQGSEMLERYPVVRAGSWINRYLGMPDLCDKGNFARIVKACSELSTGEAWSFVPKTWSLPQDMRNLKEAIAEKEAQKKNLYH